MSWITALVDLGVGVAGKIASDGADYEAELASRREREAAIRSVRLQQADALERGGRAVGRARERGSQVQGQQRVAFAAGGLDASSGTAALLQQSTASAAELDAMTEKNNARREALGHKMTERRIVAEGEAEARARKAKNEADQVALFGKFASFVGQAASAASSGSTPF